MTFTGPPPGASGAPGPHRQHSLYRSRTNRVIGGLAGGLAEHLGADPLAVRFAFVIASFALGGIGGPLLYAVAWLVVPEEGRRTSIADEHMGGQRWV